MDKLRNFAIFAITVLFCFILIGCASQHVAPGSGVSDNVKNAMEDYQNVVDEYIDALDDAIEISQQGKGGCSGCSSCFGNNEEARMQDILSTMAAVSVYQTEIEEFEADWTAHLNDGDLSEADKKYITDVFAKTKERIAKKGMEYTGY